MQLTYSVWKFLNTNPPLPDITKFICCGLSHSSKMCSCRSLEENVSENSFIHEFIFWDVTIISGCAILCYKIPRFWKTRVSWWAPNFLVVFLVFFFLHLWIYMRSLMIGKYNWKPISCSLINSEVLENTFPLLLGNVILDTGNCLSYLFSNLFTFHISYKRARSEVVLVIPGSLDFESSTVLRNSYFNGNLNGVTSLQLI